MKRSSCALGVVVMGLWVAGAPIGAEEAPVEEVAPAEQAAPAEPAPAEPVAPAEPAPPEESVPAEQVAPPESAWSKMPAGAAAVLDAGAPMVFAELLFLKPTLDDTYFAVNSPAQGTAQGPGQVAPSGRRVNDDFDFEPAFRIGAGYEFAETGREVELSYSRLDAEATESVSGNFLWATRGSPDFAFNFGPNTGGYAGSASAKIEAQYQQIDAHVTQPWHVLGLDVGLELGFEWADFRVGEDYVYVDTAFPAVGSVSAASRTWGIGPEVGIGLDYEICEPWDIPGAFSVRAGSSIGLLLSETHTRAANHRDLPALHFAVEDDETSRVLTAIHARVGIGYEVPLADRIAATVGVGYQIDTHLRGLTRMEFVDDVGRGLVSTDYYDFDLQGVYLSFGVVF